MSFHAQFPTAMRQFNVSPGRPDNGVESFDLGIKRPGTCRNDALIGAGIPAEAGKEKFIQ
jgi:hypothetical protein